MATAFAGAAAGALLVAALGHGRSAATTHPCEMVELHLRVHATLDDTNLQLAEQVSTGLLASAGMCAEWRDCSRARASCPADERVVLVQLLPFAKLTDPAVSGEFLRDLLSGVPTVIVYVPRSVELAHSIRSGGPARSQPLLATVAAGHLIGLTVAHEVGHALGLAHSRSGVMTPRPSLGEIIALRTSRLTFGPVEAAAMRQAMTARAGRLTARKTDP